MASGKTDLQDIYHTYDACYCGLKRWERGGRVLGYLQDGD